VRQVFRLHHPRSGAEGGRDAAHAPVHEQGVDPYHPGECSGASLRARHGTLISERALAPPLRTGASKALGGSGEGHLVQGSRTLGLVWTSPLRLTMMCPQAMLEQSVQPQCLSVALVALTRLTERYWASFSVEERLGMRDAIMNLLAKKGPSLDRSVVTLASKHVAVVTKMGWDSSDDRFREIVMMCAKLLEADLGRSIIGIQLLCDLVQEINVRAKSRTLQAHRKIAVSFRDISLRKVFEFAMATLMQVSSRKIRHDPGTPPPVAMERETLLLKQTLELLKQCLEYDFVGSRVDETSEDIGSIQIPSTWRDLVQSPHTIRLLFGLFRGLTTGTMPVEGAAATMVVSPFLASSTMEVLNLWASTRRSLFSSEDARRRFLAEFIGGCTDVMQHKLGLSNSDCFLQFCRLLGKLKSNYQLAELIRSTGYVEWLQLCAELAKTAFRNPTYSPLALPFILGLWSKLASAVPHAGGSNGKDASASPSLAPAMAKASLAASSAESTAADGELHRLAPEVVAAYVEARVTNAAISTAGEGPSALALSDYEECSTEVLAIPGLFRFQYEKIAAGIIAIWDPLFATHKALAAGAAGGVTAMAAAGTTEAARSAATAAVSAAGGDVRRALVSTECQLAWLVYIIGATVSNQLLGSFGGSVTEEVLKLDAALIRRGLDLLELTDQRASAAAESGTVHSAMLCDPRLEFSLVFFAQRIQVGFMSEAHGMPPPSQLSGAAQKSITDAVGGDSSSLLVPSANPASDVSFGVGSEGGSGSIGVSFVNDVPFKTTASSLISKLSTTTSSGIGASVEASGMVRLLGGLDPSGMGFGSKSTSSKQMRFLELWRLVGKGDHTEVLACLISHMATTLRVWAASGEIVKLTLDVLEGMAFSYSAGRLLNSLTSVDYLLKHHGPAQFPFLAKPGNGRARTQFYMCLARLLFLGEDADDRFEEFFAPIAATLDAAASPESTRVRTTEVGAGLEGLARDLRGIIRATHNRQTYTVVFDALVTSRRIKALINGIANWYNVHQVANPILKCVAELATNRSSRISFPSSSPNGVVLFQVVSEVLVSYAKPMLASPVPSEDRYRQRFKGTAQCLKALTLTLSGGYCPLGVFELYSDRSLDHALEGGILLLRSVPHSELHEHVKVAREAFGFLATMFHSHLDKLVLLPKEVFQGLLLHLRDGVNSLDDTVASNAGSAIDNLCTAFVRGAKRPTKETAGLRTQLAEQPSLFEDIMKLLFEIVVFSETSMWTIARPLLSSIIAASIVKATAWTDFVSTLVSSQPHDVRPRFAADMDKLMVGVTRSLDNPNKERFTRAIHLFRIEVLTYVRL
jgi:hypothetical protein